MYRAEFSTSKGSFVEDLKSKNLICGYNEDRLFKKVIKFQWKLLVCPNVTGVHIHMKMEEIPSRIRWPRPSRNSLWMPEYLLSRIQNCKKFNFCQVTQSVQSLAENYQFPFPLGHQVLVNVVSLMSQTHQTCSASEEMGFPPYSTLFRSHPLSSLDQCLCGMGTCYLKQSPPSPSLPMLLSHCS